MRQRAVRNLNALPGASVHAAHFSTVCVGAVLDGDVAVAVLLFVVGDGVALFAAPLLVRFLVFGEFVALFAAPELGVVALLLVGVPLAIVLELFDVLFWLCC